jgi:hypothetical protein
LTLDEAERAQRRVTASGFAGGRLFVDESLRRASRVAGSAGVDIAAVHEVSPVLVGAPGRVSMIFELAEEPVQVWTRRVNATTLVVDAGPLTEGIRSQTWSTPSSVDLVKRISIDEVRLDDRSVMRAQLTLPEFAWGRTRLAGRRLYVDVSWPELRQQAPLSGQLRNAAVVPAPRAEKTKPVEQNELVDPRVIGIERYRGAIRPLIVRFEEMEPFLVSATQAPPEVLAALGHTLATLGDSLRAIEVPSDLANTHGMFTSALRVAVRAVDPALRGDRATEVRQALALFDLGKAQLVGQTSEPSVVSLRMDAWEPRD